MIITGLVNMITKFYDFNIWFGFKYFCLEFTNPIGLQLDFNQIVMDYFC